jgi:peptidoglycan/LPS O-acetylase OafA/YrhL
MHQFLGVKGLQWLTWKYLLANLTLTQNLTWAPCVIPPLWSLPYEVQMYLVLPFLYALTKRRNALWGLVVLWLITAVVGGVMRSADTRYAQLAHAVNASVYDPLLWFVPTFLGGIAAFLLMRKPVLRLPAALWPVFVVGLVAAFQVFSPWRSELLMSFVGVVIPQFREIRSERVRIICHTIAKYSYGVYLIHVPLIDLCLKRLHMPLLPRLAIFFGALAALSYLAYHLVEKPMIDVGHRLSAKLAKSRTVVDEPTPAVT